jgi:DNA-binding GntR family transcriptional regulator
VVSALEIAATLAAELEPLPRGARVASEHELMRRFGTTRATARAALDELGARFLVRRIHGAGTFVHRPIDYVISARRAPSLHETVAAAGGAARTVMIDLAEVPTPTEVAAQLGCAPGAVRRRLTRLGYIDDQAASYAVEWLADGIVDHIDIRLRVVESLSDVLRDNGHRPYRASARVAAELLPAPVAERLDAMRVTPAWRIEALTRDAGTGAVLMWSAAWMRQDAVRVVVELDASAPPD